MKLKEKCRDLNDKYKNLRKDGCCFILNCSYLNQSKSKLKSENSSCIKNLLFMEI